MTIKEKAERIERELTAELLKERRKKVSEKMDSVAHIASVNNLHWICVASNDVLTGELAFRTFYTEDIADFCILHDTLEKEYARLGITYHIYGW